MRKEYLILVIFLVIIGISGTVIYIYKNIHAGSTPAASPETPMSAQSAMTQMPPNMPPSEEMPSEGMSFDNKTPQGPDPKILQQQIDMLESQLKTDPNNYDALVNLGNAYYDIGNPQKSVENYEKALKLQPNEPSVLVDCGAMYRNLGNPDKAIEMFNKAIQADPKMPQAYFNLGMVLRMEKNDPVAAAQAWKTYLQLDPNSEMKDFISGEINKADGK